MTVTWSLHTSGCKDLKVGRAYTVWAAEDAQKGAKGSSWHWGTKGMKRGDVYYIDWSGKKKSIQAIDHTGTCEKVIGDGSFYGIEGNVSDRMQRCRRDAKYIVGYVRFDWSRAASGPDPKPPPKPPAKPNPAKANTGLVRKIQKTLEVAEDGKWAKSTDQRGQTMRNCARAKAGYPKNTKTNFNIKDAQKVVDTKVDGEWGPKSQAALVKWVKEHQKALGVTSDGQWGPKTDNAYLAARKNNHNNF